MKLLKYFVFVLFILIASAFSSAAAELVIETDPQIAWQGKVLVVRLISAEGISSVYGQFIDQTFQCYQIGDDFRGVVGIPLNQKTGNYILNLFVTRNDGTVMDINKETKVWATKFPFSEFWLKPSRNKLRSKEIVNTEWAEIEKVLVVEDPVQSWKGRFAFPVEGRVSQGFGHREIINGKRAGNHRGVDFAVINGTEIKAPNAGKVVFVKRLQAFGGTMVLDHGQGIHTLYFHLSKMLAEVGQNVEKNDIIALSGNSGISSGPHLHWGISVHNLRVDPMQWVKYDI